MLLLPVVSNASVQPVRGGMDAGERVDQSSWAMSASISRDHSRRQRRLVGSSSQDPSMPFSTNSRKSSGPNPMCSASAT